MYVLQCDKCHKGITINTDDMVKIQHNITEINQLLKKNIEDKEIFLITAEIINAAVPCCDNPNFKFKFNTRN